MTQSETGNHYFRDPEVLDFMKDMESVPYISKIELTEDCQLKCPGCPTGLLTPSGKSEMPLSTLQKIVDNNWLRNTTYVELMMSGESTLHKNFSEAVDIVKSAGVMVGISTNLVDRKKIPALCKLDSITVSMDVFNKEGYEISRPPMKFDRLIDNIRELADTAKESTVIYLQLLRTPFTEQYFLQSIKDAQDFIDSLNKPNIVLRYVSDCFGEVMGRTGVEAPSKMCTTPFTACVIKSSGTVHPCGYCFTGKEEGMILGNIHTTSLEYIWDDEPIKALRMAHRLQQNLPERCMLCADKNRSNHVFQANISVDILRHRNGIVLK